MTATSPTGVLRERVPTRSGLRGAFSTALDFIGPDLRGTIVDAPSARPNSGWIAAISLVVAVALLLIAAGQGAGRRGDVMAAPLFWSGVLLLIVPATLRISWPGIARSERLALLLLLTGGLFFHKAVYSPTSFSGHDEFLHWVAADDLMTAGRLFLSNPLLPIAPTYPALEILTTAIANLTGLSLFASAMLLLAVCKFTFIVALFLLYESVCGSPRMAAMACLTYMGCTTFVLFEASFSYESLGIAVGRTDLRHRSAIQEARSRRPVRGGHPDRRVADCPCRHSPSVRGLRRNLSGGDRGARDPTPRRLSPRCRHRNWTGHFGHPYPDVVDAVLGRHVGPLSGTGHPG